MAKVIKYCKTCGKVADLSSEMNYGPLRIVTYRCGHSDTIAGIAGQSDDTLDIESLDGKRPFKYQIETGHFLEKSNGRALIAHEMGVGKTICVQIFLAAHKETRPVVYFVKAGLRVQWSKETMRWGEMMCQIVDGGTSAHLLPGFDGYIISFDSAWRIGTKAVTVRNPDTGKRETTYEPIPGKSLPEQLAKLGVKTAILDECQTIKNPSSKRTRAIQAVCREMQYVIALSGTPIKNNAGEYFPILNILMPEKFPDAGRFKMGWCDSYFDGYQLRTCGLKDAAKFHEYTKDFIIRYTRAEVLPDLPKIWRQFSYHELGPKVEAAYEALMKEYNDYYNDSGSDSGMMRSANILAYLSKMRHLAGTALIDPVCDYAEEFITSTDRKLAIFVHHKDVGTMLKYKLEQMAKEWPAEWGDGILQLTSDMDAFERDRVITQWRDGKYRICIFSTLASGEGLNLQFCSDCVMMERQWNPANEEQAEARFPRPGQMADKINATYFIAVGTVVEFFSELVEKKRAYVSNTLDGTEYKWDESSLMKDLAEIIAQRGGKRWGW